MSVECQGGANLDANGLVVHIPGVRTIYTFMMLTIARLPLQGHSVRTMSALND